MAQDDLEKSSNTEFDSTNELYEENAFSGWQKNKRRGLLGDILTSPFVWAGAAIILVVLILIASWPESDTKALSARLDHIAQRLDMLENRIFIIETESQTESTQFSENSPKNMEPLQNRMEQLEAFLHHKTSQLSSELEKINKKLSSVSEPAAKSAASKKTLSSKNSTVKYHEVKPGETLYRISINYGIPVDRLLEMNNLNKDAIIRPGQKIMVSR